MKQWYALCVTLCEILDELHLGYVACVVHLDGCIDIESSTRQVENILSHDVHDANDDSAASFSNITNTCPIILMESHAIPLPQHRIL